MLLIFLLACFGTTNILTGSKLTRGIRKLKTNKNVLVSNIGYLFSCPMCLGFWIGIVWYLLLIPFHADLYVECIAYGMISSGFCWSMRVLLHILGEDSL